MAAPSAYARRLARLPRILDILSRHPQGMRLETLAEELGVDERTLRKDIGVFYTLDVPAVGLVSEAIEYVAPDGRLADPHTAPMVRIASSQPLSELGVEYLSADKLAVLYDAATKLQALEPDNDDLHGAVAALGRSLLEGVKLARSWEDSNEVTTVLREAGRSLRRVRITYARAWRPGNREIVIDTYRLVNTRRGWEVDAGPVDPELPEETGQIRTFLVSGIHSATALEEAFARPGDLEARLSRHREPTPVKIVIPHDRRWVVDRFAERVEVLDSDSDSDGSALVRAFLLPPVRERLGLILLIAGEDAFVTTPGELRDAGREQAQRLLEHHTSS